MAHPKLQMDINWTHDMRSAWMNHFPHSLESVSIPAWPTHVDMFKSLPPRLAELHFVSDCSAGKFSSLPAQLNETLHSMEFRGSPRPENFDAPLPKNLLRCSFLDCWQTSSSAFTDLFPLLPSNLTALQIGSALLPQALTCFPPKLLDLRLRLNETPSPSQIGYLPAGLEVLHISGDFVFTEEHAAPLPRCLKELILDDTNHNQIQSNSNVNGVEFFTNLPATLRRVQLGYMSGNMTEAILPFLPPNLSALKLLKGRWPSGALTQLPPQLTSFELNETSIPDTIIPYIQSHLKINVSSIFATGALLKTSETTFSRETLVASISNCSSSFCGSYGRDISYHVTTGHLIHIPSHVTTIDVAAYDVNLGQISHSEKLDGYHPQIERSLDLSTYPNVTSVTLNQVTSLRGSFIAGMPNLKSLDLARCHRIYDDYAPRPLKAQLPSTITRCHAPSIDASALFAPDVPLPSDLKYLAISLCDQEFYKQMLPLTKLETFQCNLGWNSHLPPALPSSITMLTFTGNPKSNLAFETLPPNLKTLTGALNINDAELQRLPKSLTSLSVSCLQWLEENTSCYAPSNAVDFVVPKSLTDLARDLRFGNNGSPWASSAPDTSSSSDPVSETSLVPVSEEPKKEDWLSNLKVTNTEKPIETDVARLISSDLRSLSFTQDASADVLLTLPVTLLSLDALALKSVTEVHLENLPPTLTTLAIQGSELMADIVAILPRTLTSLSFTRLLGRINEARAQLLPPNLLTLRLGSCLIGNDAIPHLPRSLTEVSAPNSALLTDVGAAQFPHGLLKLSIPTCRLTYEGAIRLPSTLTSLHYGTGCTVPSTAILEYFKYNQQAQSHPHEATA